MRRRLTCAHCPKYQLGCCVVIARQIVPDRRACAVGRRAINSRDTYRRAKARAQKESEMKRESEENFSFAATGRACLCGQ